MIQEAHFPFAPGQSLPLLVSSIIQQPFFHGFTTRRGGVSEPPFDSFNLGWKWGERKEAVDENHRRLKQVAGTQVMMRTAQVHGTHILRVGAKDDPQAVANIEADGLLTRDRGVGISVHVADCTPILLACPRTLAIAALHAGWRGTVLGIADRGVQILFQEFGCRAEELKVVLGPCIGACCFEVGPEVVEAFLACMPDAIVNGVILPSPDHKPHVDLRRFQFLQLVARGVRPENIACSDACTFCDPQGRFYSYRKSGRATGQLVGFILRPAAGA